MSRNLERLIGIDRELRRGRYPTVQHFCEMFEVKQRTIYEDIRKLKDNFGLEIVYDRFHNGYVLTNPDRKLPSFELTEDEMSGLKISGKVTSDQAPFLKAEIEAGLDKIRTRLPDSVDISSGDIDQQIHNIALALPKVSRKHFGQIRQAIRNQERLAFSYYAPSTDKRTRRAVEPYQIVQRVGIWYLIAYCNLRKDLRLFALHRISDINILPGERFERSKNIDVNEWLANAFQVERQGDEWKVAILFRKEAAPYIREKTWKDGTRLNENQDGSCTLSFTTLSLDEVKRWIMFYGANAIVLRPKPLVKMIENELKSALKNYDERAGEDARRSEISDMDDARSSSG